MLPWPPEKLGCREWLNQYSTTAQGNSSDAEMVTSLAVTSPGCITIDASHVSAPHDVNEPLHWRAIKLNNTPRSRNCPDFRRGKGEMEPPKIAEPLFTFSKIPSQGFSCSFFPSEITILLSNWPFFKAPPFQFWKRVINGQNPFFIHPENANARASGLGTRGRVRE